MRRGVVTVGGDGIDWVADVGAVVVFLLLRKFLLVSSLFFRLAVVLGVRS